MLASCTEISYKQPQPKGVKSLAQVPAKMQGRYLIKENDDTVDTLIVMKDGYRLGNDDLALLSDSLILKYYKGYYFLNIRENFSWYLRIMRLQKNGDLTFMEMEDFPEEDEAISAYISKLSAVVPVVKTEADNQTYYIIDPEPKQLLELIKKGYFRERTFKRI